MKQLMIVIGVILVFVLPGNAAFAQGEDEQLIIVNKFFNRLAFYDQGELKKIYEVATGREVELTPEGVFSIERKIVDQPYYRTHIPGGDPRNPLGDRWMGLSVPGTDGYLYGIHGNNNESSIGEYASAGCIRMHNQEIRALYEEVKLGTKVVIVNENKSFNEIAKNYGYSVIPFAAQEGQFPLVVKKGSDMYEGPHEFERIGELPEIRAVVAEKKFKDYYYVSQQGAAIWINQRDVLEGVHQNVALVRLPQKTFVKEWPTQAGTTGFLGRQIVESFESWKDWYHIQTTQGEVWVQAKKLKRWDLKGKFEFLYSFLDYQSNDDDINKPWSTIQTWAGDRQIFKPQ